MTSLGWVHTVFAFVAIGAGGVVVLLPKGTRWHRTMGHVYVTAMVGIVATSFSMYGLTGSFGPFHIAALVSGVTLIGGLGSILLKKPAHGWLEAHATWMSWSYIGLMAAFAAESLTRFIVPMAAPLLREYELWGVFWLSVAIGGLVVTGVGWWLVKTHLPATIAKTAGAIRREQQVLLEREDQGLSASGKPQSPVG